MVYNGHTMELEPLARIDSFPYRHRVADVMSPTLATIGAGTPILDAAREMVSLGVSSLVIVEPDGRALGIVTERDMLRAFAATSGQGAVADIMTAPVITIAQDDYVFVALGRMERRGVRHLVVVDDDAKAIGVLTAGALLKQRAADTLRLGDELDGARDAHALEHVREQLPQLAEKLLAEDVTALGVSSVISAVYCDMTRRAWEMAAQTMEDEGRGGPPAPVSVLVLGSGGRGESMLSPDQDNAIVHMGSEADDAWFEEAAVRMTAMLDAAGVPYCTGDVMASNPKWRRTLDGWKQEIANWMRAKDPEAQLMTDIFFDFVCVAGDEEPAQRLRNTAMTAASHSLVFLKLIGMTVDNYAPPLGLFGGFKTKNGRLDLKLHGLLPITCAARIMALQHGIGATSTMERLQALVAKAVINEDDARQICEAHELFQKTILGQQIADIRAWEKPRAKVEPGRLSPGRQRRLKAALKGLEGVRLLVQDSLGKMAHFS